jgi:hypothetical protein
MVQIGQICNINKKKGGGSMLRNPSLVYKGFEVPDNVYDIDIRVVFPLNSDNTHKVRIYFTCFRTSEKIDRLSQSDYALEKLPGDSSLLVPSLYQSELIRQHGDQELDGILIKDFEVL